MITDNERDELIFDFLEGNLSPDEEEAFLILKDESELFNRQVRLWQNTYIEEPLPSVESLEKKLFIRTGGSNANFSRRLYTILIIVLTYVALPGDNVQQYTPDVSVKFVHHTPSILQETTVQTSKTAFDCKEEYHAAVKRTVKARPEASSKDSRRVILPVVLSERKPEPLFKVEQLTLDKIEIKKTENQQAASVVARKKWSKREVRQIRKKRRQDNRARNANEFLKGKVPYVVPLNNNNF